MNGTLRHRGSGIYDVDLHGTARERTFWEAQWVRGKAFAKRQPGKLVPPIVQGQLRCVDQEACVQLTNENGQRPERQIATLGLASRKCRQYTSHVTFSHAVNAHSCVAHHTAWLKCWRTLRLIRTVIHVSCA